MSNKSIVQRLIAFLKRPDALAHDPREPVHNPYDDYAPRDISEKQMTTAPPGPGEATARQAQVPLAAGEGRVPGRGSRLDATILRALHQFRAQVGFVVRYDDSGRMRYVTGRDLGGRFVAPSELDPDRRALHLTLDTGESQLFVNGRGHQPTAILCGPLWANGQVVGAFYLDGPLRSRLHRGVFDVYCEQIARTLLEN